MNRSFCAGVDSCWPDAEAKVVRIREERRGKGRYLSCILDGVVGNWVIPFTTVSAAFIVWTTLPSIRNVSESGFQSI